MDGIPEDQNAAGAWRGQNQKPKRTPIGPLAKGWRSQYVYHFFPRSQTLSGHISVTIGLQTKSSTEIDRAAAARSKSADLFVCNPIVTEIWQNEIQAFFFRFE